MNRLSTGALILVALSGSDSTAQAFLPNFFGGNKKENLVSRGGKGKNNKGGLDDIVGDMWFMNDSNVKKITMSLAQRSVAEEAEKFEEALLAVMSQRVQEYLQVKLGKLDNLKLTKILSMTQFTDIL